MYLPTSYIPHTQHPPPPRILAIIITMSTHERNNAHVRQQAARARALARFPGFAPAFVSRRARTPTSTPDLPTSEWFGNLPPQLAIPQSAAPLPPHLVQQLAAMASAHAAQVAAMTAQGHISPVVIIPQHGSQQGQGQAPAWYQQQQQQQQVVHSVVHPNQLTPSLLQQQHTDRLRKYGLDLVAIAGQDSQTSQELKEYEMKVDAIRKSLTPRNARRMDMAMRMAKAAKVQKSARRMTSKSREICRESKAEALKAIEEMGPERRARAFKSLTERLDKAGG